MFILGIVIIELFIIITFFYFLTLNILPNFVLLPLNITFFSIPQIRSFAIKSLSFSSLPFFKNRADPFLNNKSSNMTLNQHNAHLKEFLQHFIFAFKILLILFIFSILKLGFILNLFQLCFFFKIFIGIFFFVSLSRTISFCVQIIVNLLKWLCLMILVLTKFNIKVLL